jgi:HAD superfamily hydrolase (TIGR01509 family)
VATERTVVLCDVDGTLVDTTYFHTLAWWRALRDAGHLQPMHAIHRLVGMGGGPLVRTLLGHENPEIDEGWRREYEPFLDEVQPFAGATAFLAELSRRGITTVLATSSPADHLERLVERLDCRPLIAASTNADDVSEPKPSPAIFLTALERVGETPSDRVVVVGDSVWDVTAANAARLRCIGLECGGTSTTELLDAGAEAVYRNVGELLDDLDNALPR